jgi:hypothetical protein
MEGVIPSARRAALGFGERTKKCKYVHDKRQDADSSGDKKSRFPAIGREAWPIMMTRKRNLWTMLALAMLVAAGCAAPLERPCVPAQLAVSRLRDAEAPADCCPLADPDVLASLHDLIQRDEACRSLSNRLPQNYLALSGGGVLGSFTVGVLLGWTESGQRPQFDVVTGISTGALIATYAFLGSKYDGALRDYYSNYGARDVYRQRPKLALLWSDSAVKTEPLRQKIETALTDTMLVEVAAAHAAGRRLYIGTTNLETGKLVIWDMGAIAASGRPDARRLYADVLLASASIPGLFPPVHIDVEINGAKYQETHVDGGTTAAVFFQPFMLNLDKNDIRSRSGSNLYVIDAGKLYADPHCVDPRIIKIARTAIRGMLYAGARNDLARLGTLALITGLNYHLAAVPQDFPLNLDTLDFDRNEMRRLFDEGFRQGKNGGEWHTRLEHLGVDEDILPRSGTRFRTLP